MKLSSKKVLLWLHPLFDRERRRVPFVQIELITPELTEAGRNSLVRHLESKQLLFTDELDDWTSLTISSHGQAEIESVFAPLRRLSEPWEGDWWQVLFLQAPSGDRNFRYLRTLLLEEDCFALKRGVYLHPGKLSEKLAGNLHNSYRQSVIVIECGQWQFGDEQNVIGQKAGLDDLLSIYSGISTELKDLLTKISNKKHLNVRQKTQIASIFERIVTTMEQDIDILPHYYPQTKTALQLLSDLTLGLTRLFE